MFSTEGPIVEYFAEHNVMSYLQSGRLKYYIIKRTPGDTKTAKDNNNASKLKFIIDENLIKEVKLSMESEGKKYNPHIHLPIVVVTEDKNGTLLYEGKNYQVVSVIANGQKKLHPFMETFMTDYVKKSRIKSNKLSMVVQNGVPITTLPVKAIPTNSISSVSKLKQGEIPVHVSATNSRKDGLPIVKVPLKDLNKDLSGGLPGTEQTGIYRIFDDQGN